MSGKICLAQMNISPPAQEHVQVFSFPFTQPSDDCDIRQSGKIDIKSNQLDETLTRSSAFKARERRVFSDDPQVSHAHLFQILITF